MIKKFISLWIFINFLIYTINNNIIVVNAEYNELQPSSTMINASKTGVCQSIDIRNKPSDLRKLTGCKVVEGFVQIMLMEKFDASAYEEYSFPELREITDYLLLFRIYGLKTLEKLFPNLKVIRGNTLFQDYALLLYELMDMQEIGLKSLNYIGQGFVRIEKNPMLCYVSTIDWTLIARHARLDDHYILKNKRANECPLCPGGAKELDVVGGNDELNCPVSPTDEKTRLCWSRQYCQKVCPLRCGSGACTDNGVCCHDSCVGDCNSSKANDCNVCRHFLSGVNERRQCIKDCPKNTYRHMGRRCITKEECYNITSPLEVSIENRQRDFPYIPFNGSCILNCPANYHESDDVENRQCIPCAGLCKKICVGANIDSILSAQQLRGCTHIAGSLEIQIRSTGGMSIVKELEYSLSSIAEIDGYLKIVRSFPLVSLNFLKSLTLIRGNILESKKYALIVLDNQNLQDLWDDEHKLLIEKGKLFFHYNPKLCFYKIERLKEMVTDKVVFIDEDVAKSSNGDKIACNVTTLNVNVKKLHSAAAIIEWDPLILEDDRGLLGYIVYYIAAPYQNVTLYDGRDACGGDGWHVDDITDSPVNATVTHIITQLEPYTQYAFYVKTYTISTVKAGAQSNMLYFRTKSGQPDNVQKLRSYSNKSSEIILQWEPPKKPNGNLTSYIIVASLTESDSKVVEQRNYCQEPLKPIKTQEVAEISKPIDDPSKNYCNCSNPFDLSGSNRRKLVSESDAEKEIDFENQLHNWAYVKRRTGASGNRRKRELPIPINDTATESQLFPTQNNSDNSGTSNEVIKSEKIGNYFKTIYEIVNASTTSIVLKELRHYSVYKLSVQACREGPGPTNCSYEMLTLQRTKEIVNADNIPSLNVMVEAANQSAGSARLTWQQPDSPNGPILTYSIKYQRVDIEHSKIQLICITQRQFLNMSRSYILQDLETGNYTVQVMATTLAGDGKFTEQKYFYIESNNNSKLIIISSIVGVLLIIGIAVGAFTLRRRYLPVNNLKLIASVNPEYVSMQYTPDEWEVPRDHITKNRELGQGSFGMVYEGLLRNIRKNNEEKPCAIKTVNENATDRERINFLKEASVMKAFDTNHVVRLLGVVSCGQPTLVIMELMANGDLKGYLRSHRPDAELLKAGQTPPQPPTLKRILQMAIEIADGMAYLSAKKFVHRDLAARNCMVAEDLTVKIGDFGMTRDIYETDYYRKGTKGLLPVRWMAPESLKDGVFTSYSDVFSYGVVLWEMATLASQPYQGLSNDQVLRYVIDGGVMERPENCPDILYDMMRRCWQHRPSARPHFLEIVSILLDDANSNFRNVSFYHSDEAQEIVKQMQAAKKFKYLGLITDVTTPLRHEEEEEEEQLSLHMEPNDYSYDGANPCLVHLQDGQITTIRSAHSPLSGGMVSGIFNDNNYIISSYQSGRSNKSSNPLNGSNLSNGSPKVILSTSVQSAGSKFSNNLRGIITPTGLQQHQQSGTSGQGNNSSNSGFNNLRNTLFGSGGVIGDNSGRVGGYNAEYKKLNKDFLINNIDHDDDNDHIIKNNDKQLPNGFIQTQNKYNQPTKPIAQKNGNRK